jgi:hypothetical protein
MTRPTRFRAVLGAVAVLATLKLPALAADAATSTQLRAAGTHGTGLRTEWALKSGWKVPAADIDITSSGTVLLLLSRGPGTDPLVVLTAYRPLPGQPFQTPASYFTGTGANDTKGVLGIGRGPLSATLWCSRACTVTLPHLPVGRVQSRRAISGVQALERPIPTGTGQVPAMRTPVTSTRRGVWLVTSAVLHGAQPRSAAAMQACRDSTPGVCDADQGQELAESVGIGPSGVGVVLTRQSRIYVTRAGSSSALHAAVATQASYARATVLFCPL